MLEQADAALAGRDTALPGLALLLDASALGDAINAALPGAALTQVEKIYLRYKPGMNCLAGFRALRAGRPVQFYAKAHGPDAAIKLDKAETRGQVGVGELPGRIALAEQHLVVNFFPNDSKLKRLRRLGHADKRQALFKALMPDTPEFWASVPAQLAYKPERRFVCRVSSGSNGHRVLRFHTPAGYAALYVMTELIAVEGVPRFPRRLSGDSELGIAVHEWIEGVLLREAYCAQEDCAVAGQTWNADFVRRTGYALSRMHSAVEQVCATGAAQSTLPARSHAEDCGRVEAVRRGLAHLMPNSTNVYELSQRLQQLLGNCTPDTALIHGDFYGKQVLDTDQGVAFLDLDELCLGHPAADLGLFVAHLELESLYGWLSPARAGAVSAALLHGYSQGRGRVSAADLATYTAFGVFQLAHHPFRTGAVAWPARIDALLTICARYLDTAERLQGRMAMPTSSAGIDAAMPALLQALDVEVMTAVLRAASVLPSAGELVSCRLVRHKPGRRALVEYTVSDTSGGTRKLLGKLRAKGLDRRMFAAMKVLHTHVFNEEKASVPAPIAEFPELGLWLQVCVPGVPAWSALNGGQGSYWGARIAEAIYRLHSADYVFDRRHTLTDELHILCTRLDLVARQQSGLAARIDAVKRGCIAALASLPERPSVAIHRDFYPDQVLIDGNRLYLLDFDLLCMGDPFIDVGNFNAHLIEHGLRMYGNAEAYAPAMTSMARRYAALSGFEDAARAIEIHTLVSLARHIHLSTQFAERTAFTTPLLALCENLSARCAGHQTESCKLVIEVR